MAKPVPINPLGVSAQTPYEAFVAAMTNDSSLTSKATIWGKLGESEKERARKAYGDAAVDPIAAAAPSAPTEGARRRRTKKTRGKKTKKGGRRHKKAYTRRR